VVVAGTIRAMSDTRTEEIEATLRRIEEMSAAGEHPSLGTLGFWRAVGAVKRDPVLIDRFADRIGAIDQAAFTEWARLTVPMWLGTAFAMIATFVGLGLVALAYGRDPRTGAVLFLAGTGVLLGSTHGLGHLLYGWSVGMRFTVWFVGRGRPQPGVKTDYASYLRTPARRRAWMHASGAIVTKAVPFVLLPSAIIAGIAGWATALLVVLGVAQLVTDVVWSTKSSDWAKFRREMKYAQ